MRLVEMAHEAMAIPHDVDLSEYLSPKDRKRIIPAEALAEEGRRRMLLGVTDDPGLVFPWEKSKNRVRILPGKLAIWCGWSFHGKSQMLKQLMLSAIEQSEKVCVASMEEEVQEVWCDMGRIACGDQEPSAKGITEWNAFSKGKLWFYDQQGTVDANRVLAVIRYAAQELHVTHFVVDSLMMLAVNRDDYEAQSRFVGELKTVAKDTQCTVHLVAHLRKRDGKTGESAPGSIHDIAGAHDIGSKADYVFNVWRNKLQVPGTPDVILSIEKQRGRVNWTGTLGLNFHHRSRQFVEGASAIRYWNAEVAI